MLCGGAGEGLETAGSAATQEDGDTDSTVQADRARQKAFGRLDTYLDENGGISDPAKAGQPMQYIMIGAPSSKCIASTLSACTQPLLAVHGAVECMGGYRGESEELGQDPPKNFTPPFAKTFTGTLPSQRQGA